MPRHRRARRTGPTAAKAGWYCGASMKAAPWRRTPSAKRSGGKSIRTPSASRTSAPPLLEVMPRFPCFTTAAPQAANTNRAVVDTLKRWSWSPPVPQMSIAGRSNPARSKGGRSACPRKARTKSAISRAVSPFALSARRRSAFCAGSACGSSRKSARVTTPSASSSWRWVRDSSREAGDIGRRGDRGTRKQQGGGPASSGCGRAGFALTRWRPSGGAARGDWRILLFCYFPKIYASRHTW